ncbi:uroporphyrinogen-III C-methyltransferase [uncultured Oxalicibacterium sp.]|uniref:uroporphyrinogen-III C-methyltransferase n=1 Tax=uncultured Oxalicibacterium sp. TaxID=1168540 RepID=UPI0025EFACE4|nr:uroporphyrinogen-III C-methyltransferase [uncultured Oxalicibacterium sp.]
MEVTNTSAPEVKATTTAGKVILVGAGPGDPELLTIKAVKAIAAADVVLIDDLVNPDVLDHARADVRVIPVGKRGGCKQTPQEFIERLMLAEAQAGNCVVRLKGGDPFIFGRGGEEREHLQAAGIAVEVVNGISSGLAAPASIGIPLTHRDWTQGAVFITGHGKTPEANPDWDALAKLDLTLVIYMGIARCAEIQAALLAGGKSGKTPVAVIQSATGHRQAQLITTLEALPQTLAESGIGSPAIIVVGDVVRCADRFSVAFVTQAATQCDVAAETLPSRLIA